MKGEQTMLYVIKHNNGTYFHNKGRIILYESPDQTMRFIQAFIQYAVNRLANEGELNKIELMTIPMTIQSQLHIMEADFDIDKVECGTVYATDL